jgi:hypothetical protein
MSVDAASRAAAPLSYRPYTTRSGLQAFRQRNDLNRGSELAARCRQTQDGNTQHATTKEKRIDGAIPH